MEDFWDNLIFGHKIKDKDLFSPENNHNEPSYISNKIIEYEIPLDMQFGGNNTDCQSHIQEFENYQLINPRKNKKCRYCKCKKKQKRKCYKKII